jgi:hypothetical protein
MTDQERAALSLAESIQDLFEEQNATADERCAALKIASAMLGLTSVEITGPSPLASNPS